MSIYFNAVWTSLERHGVGDRSKPMLFNTVKRVDKILSTLFTVLNKPLKSFLLLIFLFI